MTRLFLARRFELLGTDVELGVSDPDLRELLDELFSACPPARGVREPVMLTLERGDDGLLVLCRGGLPIKVVSSPSLGLDFLLWHLNQDLVRRVDGALLVHAAVAAVGDDAVLLIGPSGAGKTTTVARLVRAGMQYLSDEFAPVSFRDGSITPAPRPLKLEPGSWGVSGPEHPGGSDWYPQYQVSRWHVAPTQLRPDCVRSGRVLPRLVVALRFEEGAPLSVERLAASEALVLVAEQAFNWHTAGMSAFHAAARLAESTRSLRLDFGNVDEAVALLCRLLASSCRHDAW